MIDPLKRRQLMGMVLFALIALVLLLVRLLPISPGAIPLPGPDLTLCLAFVWVLRRPEQVPVLLIAAVFMVEDIVLMRPPGLWTAVVVLGTEAARLREPRWREHPFMVEWGRVVLVFALMMLANRFMQAVAFLDLPSFGQVFLQFLATAFAYPFVALATRWLLGLRRLAIAEAEIMRHR